MFDALWISATGMSAQQTNMDTIANNLANVNSTGFKASRAQFADIMSAQGTSDGGSDPISGPKRGLGVVNSAITKMFTQGTLESTGQMLDVAISGDGFFQVQRSDGSVGYTRAGSFRVNENGILQNAQGQALYPEVRVPTETTGITIGEDGLISVATAQDATPRAIAQLELARFANPAGLESQGEGLYLSTPGSGEAMVTTPGQDGAGTLVQGSLERSNVSLVQEMVNMIMTQRAYEINAKAISAADEMWRMANQLRQG